jgi:cyclopropane-fatty-acyl-phospholipid synthase
MSWIGLADQGLVPDSLLRRWVRRRLAERLRQLSEQTVEAQASWIDSLRSGRIALAPGGAHAQHHEVSPRFFEAVLGPRMQHGCALWPTAKATLAEAEQEMLARSCERAGLEDGMRVLDLGCGWGGLSLWIAERYPRCRVVALSSAKSQSEWVAAACQRRGIRSVEVRTQDVDRFEPGERFDRVLSVEMFEHMYNWESLFQRIAGWLAPEGRLFAHFFCHREQSYSCDPRGAGDARPYYLTGGIMPSEQLPYAFPQHLEVERHWRIGGTHYQRTLEAWLERLDADPELAEATLAASAGDDSPSVLRNRWRFFFLACAEMFGFADGESWHVAQFRMKAATAR